MKDFEFVHQLMNALKNYDSKFTFDQAMEIATNVGCELASGATRWCFYSDECDVVVKIPRYKYTSFDYCEMEIRNYILAVKYGVEKICLPIIFVGEVNGIKLYTQRKYDASMSNLTRNAKQFKTLMNILNSTKNSKMIFVSAGHLYGSSKNINLVWYSRMLQLYGKKFLRSFELFTREAQVNDLHDSNIGWLEGKPIILDYAGYKG